MKNTQEKLNLVSLESALQETTEAQPQKAQGKKVIRKSPVVRLPKVGEYVVFAGNIYSVLEVDALSEEDEEFVVLKEYTSKRGQCLVIPRKAFYEKYESVEFLEGEKTGREFSYTPDRKSQSISFCEKNHRRQSLPATFYYPSIEEKDSLLKVAEQKAAEKKAKADERKAKKQSQKEAEQKAE